MTPAIYAARWILPIEGEPISNGEVVVEEGRISAVRPRRAPSAECRDFGDAVLMPGLVNAHTHLEYTAMRGFLEDVPFFDWVRALNASKALLTPDDWLWSARLGALESAAAGTTTIGDNTDAGVTMQVAAEAGLRGVIYQEVFGIDNREPVAPIIAQLREKITRHRRWQSARVGVGVSPHALYTIRPALFTALAEYISQENLPSSIHIAESPSESALTERGEGAFAAMYARRGIQWQTPGVSPTRYAFDQNSLGPKTLAIHCVHQTEADSELVARSGAAIIHCPKSNAKLGAGIAPLSRWLQMPGLRVGLGTDSAVSNNTLDMWEEMRFGLLMQRAASAAVENVAARQMLQIATLGGALAMGLDRMTGSLTPCKRADIIAVRLDRPHAIPATDPYAALIYTARADDVLFTLCDGEVLYDTGVWPTLDVVRVIAQARDVRARILT